MPTKTVILVRHGQAVSPDENPERPLATAGRNQVEKASAVVGQILDGVDIIYHSGKARAAETAEILVTQVHTPSRVNEPTRLNPDDPVIEIAKELDADEFDRVMIVGHLPFLGRLATYLLGGGAETPVMNFATAAVASLSKTADKWKLDWMVDPTRTES